MKTFLHKKFELNLKNKLKIKTASALLLAVSGGQDSLCLLQLCLDFYKHNNLKIGIIYIDHQWRHDTIHVTKHLINIIKNNQIQTYLYQIKPKIYLIRGTSLDGINSLVWSRNINSNIRLIRPLLNFKRSEVIWFCRHFQLPIWSDFSNFYYCSQRNRIRHELIPYLQHYFQGRIEDHVGQFLDSTYTDCEYLRQNTIKAYQKSRHSYLLALHQPILFSQHIAVQTRVLQLFFLHNFHKPIPPKLLKKIISKYGDHANKTYSIFFNGITVNYYNEWIYFK